MLIDAATLLRAYDEQLRTDAELPNATDVVRIGPLRLASFAGGRGFVTYAGFDGADAATIRDWVEQVADHYRRNDRIGTVEWKTRGHDHAPGLHQALTDNSFLPGEVESIMVGPAAGLAVDVALPAGVGLRRIDAEADVRAMSAMVDDIFGEPVSEHRFHAILHALRQPSGTEVWVAEAGSRMISAGRLEPVPGTDFAGIWGGATRPEWRRQGIYRALTAERARSAIRLGKSLIHSDSTEFSRPILERSGLIKISTTTPYTWTRDRDR
jgi:hypothetical protein